MDSDGFHRRSWFQRSNTELRELSSFSISCSQTQVDRSESHPFDGLDYRNGPTRPITSPTPQATAFNHGIYGSQVFGTLASGYHNANNSGIASSAFDQGNGPIQSFGAFANHSHWGRAVDGFETVIPPTFNLGTPAGQPFGTLTSDHGKDDATDRPQLEIAVSPAPAAFNQGIFAHQSFGMSANKNHAVNGFETTMPPAPTGLGQGALFPQIPTGAPLDNHALHHATNASGNTVASIYQELLRYCLPRNLPSDPKSKAFYPPREQELLVDSEEDMRVFIVTENAYPSLDDAKRKVGEIILAKATLSKFKHISPEGWVRVSSANARKIVLDAAKVYRNQMKVKGEQIIEAHFEGVDAKAKHAELLQITQGKCPLTRQWDSQTHFWRPIIQFIFQTWFGSPASLGHLHPTKFCPDKQALCNGPIAFAITALEAAVGAEVIGLKDRSEEWGGNYTNNLATLDQSDLALSTYQYRAAIYKAGSEYYFLKGHPVHYPPV
ncbi:hypothetical protein BV22DRAFT_1127071 [Leucogyrophana mollusca]|uniref:Uncharacterized protein n=1 Tax=Leucogyrophana mollusca TaxID=85980 RepID=A0ACB8BSL5_9AGAM|nr:hypothetical protein BV22DRAFT_1127071 [Leucogyrophana mollusca]